jgi:hypothetical protein
MKGFSINDFRFTIHEMCRLPKRDNADHRPLEGNEP